MTVKGINGLTQGKSVPWDADEPPFVSWRSVEAERWREREDLARVTSRLHRFCPSCGLVHRLGNHRPQRGAK